MTSEAVDRVQDHFERLGTVGLAERFYNVLFAEYPELRPLFPENLAELREHFTSMLRLVIENLGRVTAVDIPLRDLGARHLAYGAQPQHYLAVRDVLLEALRQHSGSDWSDQLAHDWRLAITMILVPMLHGAAVETAGVAQRLAAEDLEAELGLRSDD